MRSAAPRRVVVALPRPARGRPEIDAIASALGDSLRSRIDAHSRFIVVAADSVASALRESRTVNAVQERLDADVIVSVALIPARDSVVRLITIRDLSGRAGSNYRTVASTVAVSDPTAGLSELAPSVVRALSEVDRAPRQRPPGDSSRVQPPARPRPPTGSPRPPTGSPRPPR